MKKMTINELRDNLEIIFIGGTIEIDLPLDIIKMFIVNNSEYYSSNKGLEKAFCGLLAYIISQENFEYVVNDSFSSPFFCNEVDLFFEKNNKQIIIEFTMSDKLTQEYVQKKIYNHYLIKQQLKVDSLKTIIVFMNKDSLINQEIKDLKGEFKEHIKHFNEEFSIIGYDDSLPKLNDEEYITGGFMKLREIFNSILDKLSNEVNDYLKQ